MPANLSDWNPKESSGSTINAVGGTSSNLPGNTENFLDRIDPSRYLEQFTEAGRYDLVHAKLGIVASLFYALHAKHVPTASHSLRVALRVSCWGMSERLRPRELELVEVAALLHDIGKIGVPDSILQKPERLSADEQSIMALHPHVGVEILRTAGASLEVLESIQNAPTWFNKYPSESHAAEFHRLASQMIAIVDAYDAMTTDQIYRKALPQETAISELFKNSGTQFNPKLVRSFSKALQSSGDDLKRSLSQRWVHNLQGTKESVTSHFPQVGMLNLNAAQQSLTSIFRNQLLDTMQDAVIFIDLNKQILEWNCTAEKLTGISKNSVLQHRWSCSLVKLRTPDGILVDDQRCPVESATVQRHPNSGRYELLHRDGRSITIEVDVVPVVDLSKNLCGAALFFRDASEQVSLEKHVLTLHERATQDPLTKVANRAELNRRLPEFVKFHQEEQVPGSLIICDIDFFKRINDTYGHPAGDEALVVFASILESMTRESDLVARYGGEEFVILSPECDLDMAVDTAERIRKELQNRPLQVLRSVCLSASFGVSSIQPGESAESLLGRADRALLFAKESGRNCVVELERKTRNGEENDQGGWLRWFGLAPGAILCETELLSDVPMELSVEKIRGFVIDHHAEVLSTEKQKISLKVDCRHLKTAQRDTDRPATLCIDLSICEVEYSFGEKIQVRSLIQAIVRAAKTRDRRTQNLVHQAETLRAVLQSYLAAQVVDENHRQRMRLIQS